MNIRAPYATCEVEILKECGLSQFDRVERAGYVSPDKKIETFLQTGQLLQNMRAGGDDYELQGEETDTDPDSPEYREELTQDAENCDIDVMPQHFDKLDAMEILDNAEKSVASSEKQSKVKKDSDSEQKTDISKLTDSIVSAIEKASEKASEA